MSSIIQSRRSIMRVQFQFPPIERFLEFQSSSKLEFSKLWANFKYEEGERGRERENWTKKKSHVKFTCHIVRRDPARILPGCCGCWGRIRIAAAVPPLPCAHTVPHSATLFRCPSSTITQANVFPAYVFRFD